MSQSDYYAEWVERHKYEDVHGRWWVTDQDDKPIEGPYTEEEIDPILWERALEGAAVPGPA